MNAAGPRIRILAVDDHPLVRGGIAGFIGVQEDMVLVAEAANGREAIQQFRTHRPDVTLMDLQMPEMSGAETARRIRANPASAHVPLVAMTADSFAGESQRLAGIGMDDAIEKPIDATSIDRVVHRWLLR